MAKPPPIDYHYNRLGQNTRTVHGDSTHTYAFNGDGALARQSTVGGPLHGVSLEQSFDASGRREHLTAHLPHGQRLDQHYGFDQRVGSKPSVKATAKPVIPSTKSPVP